MLVDEPIQIRKLYDLTALCREQVVTLALQRGYPVLLKLDNTYVFWSRTPEPIPREAERCPFDDPSLRASRRVDAWKDAPTWRGMSDLIVTGLVERYSTCVSRYTAIEGIDFDQVRIARVERLPMNPPGVLVGEKYPWWHTEDKGPIAAQIRAFTDTREWAEYGIRVMSSDLYGDHIQVAVGDLVGESYQYPDEYYYHEPDQASSGVPMGGTSTIGVRAGASTGEVLQAMKLLYDYCFLGPRAVLVGAHQGRVGQHPGERILTRPKVLQIWDCRIGRLEEVAASEGHYGLILNPDGTPGVVFESKDLYLPRAFAVELGYGIPPGTSDAWDLYRNVGPADVVAASPPVPRRTADAASAKDLILIASLAAAAAVATKTLEWGPNPEFSAIASAVRSKLPRGYAGRDPPKGFKGKLPREDRPQTGFSLRTLRVGLGKVYGAFMASDSRNLPHKVILIGQLTHMVAWPDGTFKDNPEPASKVMAETVFKGLPVHVKATSECTAAEICALLERARKKHEGARRARP